MTLVLLALTFYSLALGQVPDAKIDWLARNAVAVRSIDPQDDDFADLMPLKKMIGHARVVQLGEQNHGEGATFYAKGRLVRFLHEQMGFDVLAWESGVFDCEEMNRAFESGVPAREAAEKGVLPIWTQSGQVLPVFEYISSTFKTPHPLRQTGVDMQDFKTGDLKRLFELIDAVDPSAASPADRKIIEAFFRATVRKYQPSKEEREQRQAAMRRVLDALRQRSGANLLCKAVENISALEVLLSFGPFSEKSPKSQINFRDVKMGENLVWLARERYPKSKIIVWAASRHIARNLQGIETRIPDFSYQGWATMGDAAHRELKNQVYTIGFTAYQGEAGRVWRPANRLPVPDPASLESLLHTTKMPYALVNFRGLPKNHWLRRPLLARPLGYREMLAAWPSHLDAMFYTDVMFPSTTKGDVPAR